MFGKKKAVTLSLILIFFLNACNSGEITPPPSTKTNQFTISFFDEIGNLLNSKKWDEGSLPSYQYDGPSDTQEWDYTFLGWSNSFKGDVITIPPVTEDALYFAIVDQTKQTFPITFYDENNQLIETVYFEYGAIPTCSYSGPENDAQWTNTFIGWSLNHGGDVLETLPSVNGPASFHAIVNKVKNKYTITFKNYDETILSTSTVDYGETATYQGPLPTKSADYTGYLFSGKWTTTNSGNSVDNLTNVISDRVVYAQFDTVSYKKVVLDDYEEYRAAMITDDGRMFLYGICTGGECADAPVIYEGGSYLPANGHELVIDGEKFIDASIGYHYGLGLTESGKIYSWGYAANYCLGDGQDRYYSGNTFSESRNKPELIVGVEDVKFVKVMAHLDCAFGLTEDGDIYAWGKSGDLKRHTNLLPSKSIIEVNGKPLKFIDIVRTRYCVAGLTEDGDIYAWGNNGNLEFGDSNGQYDSSKIKNPTLISDGIIKYKQICGSFSTFAAVSTEGTLYMCGNDSHGLLIKQNGYMNFVNVTGQDTTYPNLTVDKISLGRSHGLLVSTDGTVYSWGWNKFGALGIGKTESELQNTSELKELDTSGLENSISISYPKHISCGTFTNYLITSTGKILSWGYGYQYLLGDGNYYPQNSVLKPQLVLYPDAY